MTTLTISARNLNPKVNYKEFKEIKLNNPLFTIRSIQREVESLQTKKGKKKATKMLQKTMLYATSILTMLTIHEFTSTSMALASVNFPATETDSIVANTTPQTDLSGITPDRVMEWGLKIGIITLTGSFSIAMVLLTVTGIYSMFRRRAKASQWASDIIRGFVQSLIAIPLIYALFYLATTLFDQFGFFNGIS